MSERWINTTIGSQVTLQRGIDITKASQRPGNVPVVSSGGVSSFHDTPFASGPGVVLGRKGVVGSVYYIDTDYWPHDTSLWVRDFHGNHPRFVYYFFRHLAPRLSSMDVGSANPTLNRNHVHPISVQWPPLPEQRAIAHVLGSLDDKIELNRQMNRTLDELARTLFTSWFVDFDPVRARAEGRQPEGMDAGTAALFPDRFVDSALGPIPEGWKSATLRDIAAFTKGRSYKSSEIADSDTALVTLKSFHRGGGYREDGLKPYTGIFKEAQQITPGEVVVALTDVTQAAEVIGQPAIVLGDARFDRLVASLDVAIVRPRTWISSAFLYGVARSQRFNAHSRGHTTGTTVLHLSPRDIESFLLPLPTESVVTAFTTLVQPMLDMTNHNAIESRTLAELHDTLLPELISGRLRVGEAEQAAFAV